MSEELYGRDYYDSGTDAPGRYATYQFEQSAPFLRAFASKIKDEFNPETVLDVGCAKGYLVNVLREMGIEAFGVDISRYAISEAPHEIQPHLYREDLNKGTLPFEDRRFDLVTSIGTIEYLQNYRHALEEIKRVLIPGGIFHFGTRFKRPKGDIYRINCHSKQFWIQEIEAIGFELFQYQHSYYLLDPDTEWHIMMHGVSLKGKGIRHKVGYNLYRKFGYLGRKTVLLYSYLFFSIISGSLLFRKLE